MTRSLVRLALALALVAPAALPAQQIKLGTGLAANGTALADGATDPFWSISTDGGNTFTSAKVLGNAFNTPCGCGILANALSGKWINQTGAIGSGYPIGRTVYTRRTFDLTGYDLSTVSIGGSFSVMDSNLGLYLNGHLIPGSTLIYPSYAPWMFLTNFAVQGNSGWFTQGINTLEFQVTSVNGVYDGVMLQNGQLDGTMVSTTPEPASVVLIASGLLGVFAVGRRRRA